MSLATMSSQTSKPPQALRFLHKKFKHILLSSHTPQNTAKLPNVCLITVKVSEKKKKLSDAGKQAYRFSTACSSPQHITLSLS